MSKCRVVYKQNGEVAIIIPAPKSVHSIDEAIKRIYEQQFKGLAFDDLDISELPNSRDKRYAWRGEKGKGVKIDTLVPVPIDYKQLAINKLKVLGFTENEAKAL